MRTEVATKWVLGFFSEYPLDKATLDDRIASENPMVLESLEAPMQTEGRIDPIHHVEILP
jgi:hypothetical protein